MCILVVSGRRGSGEVFFFVKREKFVGVDDLNLCFECNGGFDSCYYNYKS